MVAGGGWGDKFTGLVGVDLTSGFHDGSVTEGRTDGVDVRNRVSVGTWVGVALGGAYMLSCLVEMTFDHSGRSGRIFAEGGERETGELNESFVECLFQGG